MKVYPDQLKQFLPTLSWDTETLSTNLSMIGHETEVVNDALDVKIFPNRGDVLSLRGLSRELAAFYPEVGDWHDVEVAELPVSNKFFDLNISDAAKPKVIADHLLKIDGYVPTKSPDAVKDLLKPLGLQSKDLLVDLTNIVAYEVGVPLHSFDIVTVEDGMTIDVSTDDEKFVALNKKEVSLPAGLLIARNDRGEVVDLLGTMGGDNSAIGAKSETILLQAAAFSPAAVRNNSRNTGIVTEASHRYERGVDPNLMSVALGRFVHRLKQSLPEIKASAYQAWENLPKNITVEIGPEYVSGLLGVEVSQKNLNNLSRLGFEVEGRTITAPSWRYDIKLGADVAEEIARQIGLNNIPAKELTTAKAAKNVEFKQLMAVKHALASAGFSETLTYSFTKEGPVRLQNPRSEDQRALRSSLKEGLLKTVARNPFLPKSMFFEIGAVFLPEETTHLGIVVAGYKEKQLEPIRTSLTQILGTEIELNPVTAEVLAAHDIKQPRIYLAELSLADVRKQDLTMAPKRSLSTYRQVSKFPPVVRDVTLVVDAEVDESVLVTVLCDHPFVLITEEVDRFVSDQQLGPGKIARTFRIFFQHLERSLTDEEATKALEQIFHNLSDKVKFEQR